MIMLALFGLMGPGEFDDRPEPGQAILPAIGIAYEANHAVFTSGLIRFAISFGSAESVGDAMSGNWTNRTTARGTYAFDGPLRRYDRLFTVEDTKAGTAKIDANHYTKKWMSIRLASNEAKTLVDDLTVNNQGSFSHSAEVKAGSDLMAKELSCPLKLGQPLSTVGNYNLVFDLKRISGAELGIRVEAIDEHASLNGSAALHLSILYPKTERFPESRREYWLAMERGAVPLMIRDTADGQLTNQLTYDDIRLIPDKGWFPYRMTIVNVSKGKANFIQHMEISEAQLTQPPPRAEFRLKFPEPIAILDVPSSVKYRPQLEYDITNLPVNWPGRSDRVVVSQDVPVVPMMPGVRSSHFDFYLVSGILGVIMILIATISILKNRNQQRTTGKI